MMEEKVKSGIVEMMERAAFRVPDDVLDSLRRAAEEETGVARSNLMAILENLDEAGKLRLPICQDTGTPTFFIELGEEFPIKAGIYNLITDAVREATRKVPLRPNSVNPWTYENPGDNTGRFIPIIHVDIVPGDRMKVVYLAKGGGSENVSQLFMLPPVAGLKGIKQAVINAAYNAGTQPCPPVIIGVGVGGSADIAMKLAKKATLRPLNEANPDENLRKVEEELKERINSMGIGPMGLGGRTFALAVHIEWAHKHPASLPVGVSMLCWAARKSVAEFLPDGEFRIIVP